MVKWGSPFEGFEEKIRYWIANGEFELVKTRTRSFQNCILCKTEIPPKSKPAIRKYMDKNGFWKAHYLCSYCFERDSISTEDGNQIWM